MSSVVISGDTSGSVSVTVPATAGSNTITLPALTGTAVIAGQNSAITAGTSVASTSGTSIDFTSIPSWVKRVTVMLNGVSTNGASVVQLQLGAGSVTTTGYNSSWTGTTTLYSQTTGFGSQSFSSASDARNGSYVLTNISGNTWVSSCVISNGTTFTGIGAGTIALGGVLDRVRITTVNGTDTFDAGSINILYE
jgi:hypothetical protein